MRESLNLFLNRLNIFKSQFVRLWRWRRLHQRSRRLLTVVSLRPAWRNYCWQGRHTVVINVFLRQSRICSMPIIFSHNFSWSLEWILKRLFTLFTVAEKKKKKKKKKTPKFERVLSLRKEHPTWSRTRQFVQVKEVIIISREKCLLSYLLS